MDCGLDAAFLDHQPKFSLAKIDLQGKVIALHLLPYVSSFFFLYLFLRLDVTSCIDDVRSCSCVYAGLNVIWH